MNAVGLTLRRQINLQPATECRNFLCGDFERIEPRIVDNGSGL
jgi:hypothetical protein